MKEEILKELAALKDSIIKVESSCNKSISDLRIETNAIKQEFFDFKNSNKHINYEIGVLLGDIEKSKKDIMEIREMILHIDYWLSNSGIKEESENSNIQNLKKENEELKKRNEELTIENQLISISNIEDFELSKTKLNFCGIEGFNEMLNNIQKGNVIKAKDVENRLKEENLKLKKAFGEISRMLDDCL